MQEIVATCEAIEQRRFNPFFLDVRHVLDTIRLYFPLWASMEDHCLDAHTINKLAAVIRLQNSQLRFQSSTLYSDPEFMREKIKLLSPRRLAEILLRSWHPVVEWEQLTESAVEEAAEYWNNLTSFRERLRRLDAGQAQGPGRASMGDLEELGIISERDFAGRLEALRAELRERGRVEYWKFIKGANYAETVERAYLTSFLITYGHAQLKRDDVLELVPVEGGAKSKDYVSYPISIESGANA